MYVLGYSAGCYEDRYQNTILCTKDKSEAENMQQVLEQLDKMSRKI